jgi:hypothetical protein
LTEPISTLLDRIHTKDRIDQGVAYQQLLAETERPVDWAYEVWDNLVKTLTQGDNRQRSIASQLLCNLAKSDPESRILDDFDVLLNVTRDEKFVTARHCLQSLWKIGLAGGPQRERLVAGLTLRFNECLAEKNGTLIRYDIMESLKRLYDAAPVESVRDQALALITTETDLKYRKKYSSVWKIK